LKPGKHTVTLKDIAAKTGFSVNTVSRVLRGKSEIAENTREVILTAAREMGHVRNMVASSLRSGYTHTIAVILGDVANPHFAIMMSEIEQHARNEGYTSFLINTGEDEKRERDAIYTALNQNADGIIICPTQRSIRNIDFLRERQIPFVLIGRRTANASYVICNDELGGYQAANYLISAGHRDILLIMGPDYISSAADRKAGYLRAFREAGLRANPELMLEVPVTATGECAEAVQRLIQNRVHFSAVFAFSDIIAWQCLAVLQAAGIRVPEDVSIIGFDYIQSRLALPFNLASISSHKRHMSTTAVDVLLSAIQSRNVQKYEQVIIDTSLVTGDTVARLAEL